MLEQLILPLFFIFIRDNTSVAAPTGLTIEQDGTGDAVSQYLLTGGRRWVSGIDNSDGDKFKIASSADLNTDAELTIQASGEVGIGTTAPTGDLTIVRNNADLFLFGGNNDYAGTIRLTESATNWLGGYMQYDGASNNLIIGMHNVGNTNTANDRELVRINRISGFVGINTTANATEELDVNGTIRGGFGMVDVSLSHDDPASQDDDFHVLMVAANPNNNQVYVRTGNNKNTNMADIDAPGRYDGWASSRATRWSRVRKNHVCFC